MRGETMDGICEWIREIVFYMILMTMIMNLLPDKKYEKYLRLFTGTILILLVFRPAAGFMGLDEKTAGIFERITFQNDAKLLKREIKDADGKRLAALADGYQKAIETDLMTMSEGVYLECIRAEVSLETDPDREHFGRIRAVELRVKLRENHAGERDRYAAANREIGNLKKRIGEYYGVEEGNITVTLEDQ